MDDDSTTCCAVFVMIAVFVIVGVLVTWVTYGGLIWLAANLFGG